MVTGDGGKLRGERGIAGVLDDDEDEEGFGRSWVSRSGVKGVRKCRCLHYSYIGGDRSVIGCRL